MKKEHVLFILSCVILLILMLSYVNFALADYSSDEQEKIPLAYNWLINNTRNKWSTLGINASAFSLLALKCNSTFLTQGNRSLYNQSYYVSNSSQKIRCWKSQGKPSSSRDCKLFDTAIAKLALNEIQDNTSSVDNWLLSNKRVFTNNIFWYLQIDVPRDKEVSCEIMYQNFLQNVTIFGNKSVAINPGSGNCIENVYHNYWFKIKKDESCYSNIYTIKCFGNESDIGTATATLLYNNDSQSSMVRFSVSSEMSSGIIGYVNQIGEEIQQPGVMELNIPSYCLGNPSDAQGVCDYEGTAWAAFVWQREGEQDYANMFIPYLVVYSSQEGMKKYFPESFLSTLVSSYTDLLIQDQQRIRKPQSSAYWSFWLNEPFLYGQFYDTPKAALALGDMTPNILEIKDYLLARLSTQYNWRNDFDYAPAKNTLRDTAFILWVFWQSYCPGAGSGQGSQCEQQGANFECKDACDTGQWQWPYTCPSGVCCENLTYNPDECVDSGGTCINGTSCPGGYGSLNVLTCPTDRVCCKEFNSSYCSDFNRSICMTSIGEYCQDNQIVTTLDGYCCLSSCIQNNTGLDSCWMLNGDPCELNEICWDSVTSQQVSFIPAYNEQRCCKSPSICIRDATCASIGKNCNSAPYGPGYQCVMNGSTGSLVATRDITECCLNDCKKSCDSDKICSSDETCEGDEWDQSSIQDRCCLSTCKSAGGRSLWWLFVIIIVIIAVIVVYFFVFRKKKPASEESEAGEFEEFPLGPGPQEPKKKEVEPFEKKFEMPVFKPFSLKPTQTQKPVQKIEQRQRTEAEAPIEKPKQSKKSKAEEELEETLGKLKKLTKK
jgi:cbb3-type cytochrome oxidase subunit 3